MVTFMSEGEATGIEIATVAFDENQLSISFWPMSQSKKVKGL
jgi:hypothetical protein